MRCTSDNKEQFQKRLSQIKVLALDVDGVLTDGGVFFSSDGTEIKRFHVSDGLGLTVLQLLGIDILWITGRESAVVTRRANELKITCVMQGVRDKGAALAQFAQERGISQESIAYVGDDWNDLLGFEAAGVKIAVANAVDEVQVAADAITERTGGSGAVREVCESIMDARGERGLCLQAYLTVLRSSPEASSLPQ